MVQNPPTAPDSWPFYQPVGQEVALFLEAYNRRLPLLIKGPTGCGKTRFVRHMAARLGRPLFTVACHDDLGAADLVGRHLLASDGSTRWQDGPLTRAVRQGGICYLDEVVEARKDTTVIVHPLADDRRQLPLERTGEVLDAPPEFMLVVSYNPGYRNMMKGLKPSTRQRFVSLRFGFPPPEVEVAVIMAETGLPLLMARRLVALGNALRSLADVDLEEGVGTRLLIHAAALIQGGVKPLLAGRHALAEALSDDIETVQAVMDVIEAHLEG
ncbi:MAG: CbbQ/NirQ/NorQ/GpvN family protein [Magnetococcus sp. WYHC-3]